MFQQNDRQYFSNLPHYQFCCWLYSVCPKLLNLLEYVPTIPKYSSNKFIILNFHVGRNHMSTQMINLVSKIQVSYNYHINSLFSWYSRSFLQENAIDWSQNYFKDHGHHGFHQYHSHSPLKSMFYNGNDLVIYVWIRLHLNFVMSMMNHKVNDPLVKVVNDAVWFYIVFSEIHVSCWWNNWIRLSSSMSRPWRLDRLVW